MAPAQPAPGAGAARDDRRHIGQRRITVGEHFALEAAPSAPPQLRGSTSPCGGWPPRPQEQGSAVRGCFYLVLARDVGRRLDVRVGEQTIAMPWTAQPSSPPTPER